jgi:hypothetical protein
MRFWISPFELTNPGLGLLEEAGLHPWEWEKGTPPSQDCLLLYDTPDQLLANASSSPGRAITTPEQLLEGYLKVMDWSQQAGQPMLAIWRLQQLGPAGLGRWLAGAAASEESEAPHQPQAPAIPPLVAAATLALIEACPKLLDSYLDIELKAELFGGDADLNYRQCLRQASMQGELLLQALHAHVGRDQLEVREDELNDAREGELLLQALHAQSWPDQLEVREDELNDAREAAELTLLQLHQVQEELETLSLANQEKQQLLDAQTKEFETRSADGDGLRQKLELRESALKDAREEAELILLQLHQRQEELKALSIADRDKQQLLDNQTKELENSSAACAGLRQQLELREGERNDAREEAELTLLQLHQVQEEFEHYVLQTQDFARLASDAAAITGRLWIQHQVFEGVAP